MARLLDRLASYGTSGIPRFVLTWSQRVCEQIESLFTEVFRAISTMSDIPDVTVRCSFGTGAPLAGQLPRYIQAQRFTGSTDNTADASWSLTSYGGAGGWSVAADGLITISSVIGPTVLTVTSGYDGVSLSKTFNVIMDFTSPDVGPNIVSTEQFTSINSTTPTAITGELDLTVGASGTVSLNASILAFPEAVAPTGITSIATQWYYWNGAAWAPVTTFGGATNVNVDALGTAYSTRTNNYIADANSIVLPVGSAGRFKLYAYISGGTTRTIHFDGAAAASTS